MKKVIWAIGMALLLFNILLNLIISSYSLFNGLMADLSIAISTVLIYFSASSRLDDGYKIGLTWLLSVTGFARMLCCIVLPQNTGNNILLIIAAGILLMEILCLTIPILLNSRQ